MRGKIEKRAAPAFRPVYCLVSLVILLLTPVLASAQYRFDSWTTDNGLPHNTIRAILQTRDGYLWLASLDGLVRYDGVRFTVFNTGNTPGLKSNRLTSLFEDQSGRLLIGTEESGLVQYKEGVFTTFTPDQGFPGNLVRAVWSDDHNNTVLLIGNRGLVRWENDKAEPYVLPGATPPLAIGENQRNGMVWYCDPLGLNVVVNGQTTTLNIKGDAAREVIAVLHDRQGTIWVGTRHLGLWRFKDGTVTNITTKEGLPENVVRSIVEDRRGTIWLACGSSGLVRYENGVFTAYKTEDGLSDNTVIAIYEDREENLWVGTNSRGLNKLGRDVVSMYSDANGLPANGVYPILEDRSGAIWLGVWPKGLARFQNGQFTLVPRDNSNLPGTNLTALAEDREGAIWIGAYDSLSRYKDGRFTDFKPRLGQPGFHYVAAILPDRDGAIWFGANSGLFRLKDDVVTHFNAKDGLAGNEVKAIIQDHKGSLWVGSYGGVNRYENGSWRSFTLQDGLATEKVRSLYEDTDGVIWVGTYDGGLSRIKNDNVVSITQKEGLYNNGVFQTLEDDRGNFWLSCNLGIYRVSKQQLNDFADGKVKFVTSVPYGRHDGLSNIECNGGTQPAGIRTRAGQLWFPTQGGAAVIDPSRIAINPQPPPVVIETIVVDRNIVDARRGVTIWPNQQSLEISYTGLSFVKPEQLRFKYKMADLDGDWIEVGSRRTAYYSHLPPGTYQFTVIAANSDGVWNNQGQTVVITVVAPFWKKWWFFAFVMGVVALVGFAVYRRRISQLYRARAAQEAFSRQLIESQETERKRIAGELHDSIGQNLLIIKNRALLGLTENAPQSASVEQLNEISSAATQTIEEVRAIAGNLRPYKLDRLGLTKALASIVDQARNSSEIHFTSEIDQVNGLFSKEAEINLFRIVQESLNNILKHSKATEVSVVVKRDDQSVHLEIHDNGVGFDAALMESSAQRGFGLAGIGERVRIIGGKYSLRSSPGQGTTISIRIEVPPN